jgi:superfamily II DNA or RNA helicase
MTWILPFDPAFNKFIHTFTEGKELSESNLFKYQQFVINMFHKDSPYRGVLLYHGLGVGKTRSAIKIAESLGRDIIVMLPASLRANFEKELDEVKSKLKREYIHYNGLMKKNVEEMQNIRLFDNKTVIIDETHNFISGVKNGSTILKSVYNLIQQTPNLKIICLSGTPIINDARELSYIFNLINGPITRYTSDATNLEEYKNVIDIKHNTSKPTFYLLPDNYQKVSNGSIGEVENSKSITKPPITKTFKYELLPTNENEFYDMFIENFEKNKDIFSRRINGLVSFYEYFDAKDFAKVNDMVIEECDMSDVQLANYATMRLIEIAYEKKMKKNSKNKSEDRMYLEKQSDLYRAYTRAICNFSFPNEVKRPYTSSISRMMKETDDDIAGNKISDEDELEGGEQLDSKDYKTKLENALIKIDNPKFMKDNLHTLSPKMHKMLKNIEKSEGPVMVYSTFKNVEGIHLFSCALSHQGYEELKIIKQKNKYIISCKDWTKPKYIVFENKKDSVQTNILLSIFNSDIQSLDEDIKKQLPKDYDNKYGKFIKCIMITKSGSEGISLKNVRQVHLMEPYWNMLRVKQVIGRAVRAKSHDALKKSERVVDVFLYISKINTTNIKKLNYSKDVLNEPSTDQYILGIAKRKDEINQKFLDIMKVSALDCKKHYKNHKIKCNSYSTDSNTPLYVLGDISLEKNMKEKITLKPVLVSRDGKKIHKTKDDKKLYRDDNGNIYLEGDLKNPVGKLEGNKIVYKTI